MTNVHTDSSLSSPRTPTATLDPQAGSTASTPPGSGNYRDRRGQWTADEDERLIAAVNLFQQKNWKKVAEHAFAGSKSDVQCLHRWQKVLRPGLVKGE